MLLYTSFCWSTILQELLFLFFQIFVPCGNLHGELCKQQVLNHHSHHCIPSTAQKSEIWMRFFYPWKWRSTKHPTWRIRPFANSHHKDPPMQENQSLAMQSVWNWWILDVFPLKVWKLFASPHLQKDTPCVVSLALCSCLLNHKMWTGTIFQGRISVVFHASKDIFKMFSKLLYMRAKILSFVQLKFYIWHNKHVYADYKSIFYI